MSLTAEDRLDIHEVIALHGHLCDAGAYARFGECLPSTSPTSSSERKATALGPGPRALR
jgi:hypothetical protein